MKARIEIANEITARGLLSLPESIDTLAVAITVGDPEDFIRNVLTITLEGPDDQVRPIVTHLMDFIHEFSS